MRPMASGAGFGVALEHICRASGPVPVQLIRIHAGVNLLSSSPDSVS